MKLSEVASDVHGTSVLLNFTHPEVVCIIDVSSGVGRCISFRIGGSNTATINIPTKRPIKIQLNENIYYLLNI
jgi:hypothetical protein